MERAAGLAGQRVHAEGAARPDADRLKRVVGFRLAAGAFGAGRAEVYIKARACCGRLRSKGGFGRDRCDGGCVRLPGRCSLLLREAAGVSNDIIDRMVRPGGGIGQRTGQVLNALLLRCSVEKPGVVGCFSGGALLLAGLKGFIPRVQKEDNIDRGDGKEEHHTQQKDEQHNNIGSRTAEQCQQGGTDGRTQNAALPEIGTAAGEEHLDDLPYLEAFHIQLGEDDRHTGAENPHQGDFPRKERYAVAGGQQIGKIQQKRPDQIGRDAEDAKIPAAQRAPEILAGHQHKRYAQQAKAYQQNTAGKVRGLRTALGAAGRLPVMPGTAACGRSAPRIAAGGTFGRAGALFGAGALCGFFAGTRLCHGIAFPSLAFSKNDMHTVYNNTACIYRRIRTYDFYFITIEKPCKVKCCPKNVRM